MYNTKFNLIKKSYKLICFFFLKIKKNLYKTLTLSGNKKKTEQMQLNSKAGNEMKNYVNSDVEVKAFHENWKQSEEGGKPKSERGVTNGLNLDHSMNFLLLYYYFT